MSTEELSDEQAQEVLERITAFFERTGAVFRDTAQRLGEAHAHAVSESEGLAASVDPLMREALGGWADGAPESVAGLAERLASVKADCEATADEFRAMLKQMGDELA